MEKIKSSGFIYASLIALVFAAGMFLIGSSARADKISLVIPSDSEHILYAYLWLAKDKGYFERAGLDVSIALTDEGASGDSEEKALVEKVASGESPIGAMAIEYLVADAASIPRIVPFTFFMYGESETSTYDTHLVASKRSGIKSVADLKGKTVRLGQPPTHVAMANILREAGLTLDDIKIVMTPSHDVLGALQSGEVDAAITYYPTMPVILASGNVTILRKNIFANYVMGNTPQTAIGVNKEFAAENPDTVKRFLQAMEEAFDYGEDNPKEVILAYMKLKEFGGDDWTLDEELFEKGAALMPKIGVKQLDDFFVTDGEKETVFEILEDYQALLTKVGWIEDPASLAPVWENYLASAKLGDE